MPAPAVRSVSVRPIDIPSAVPAETAVGAIRSTPLVLIDVVTDAGLVGRSYLRCYTPLALRSPARLVEDLSGELVRVPADPLSARRVRDHFALLGTTGLVGMAIAGLDMAFWDVRAQAEGVPLATLLGARTNSVRTCAVLTSMAADAAALEAATAVAAGFDTVKIKLGGGDLDADLRALAAVRDAVDRNIRVIADHNQSLSVDEALRRIARLESYELAWIEDPTRADDLLGHRTIRAAASTPIALGENAWGPEAIAASIAAEASDLLVLDAARIGGCSGWLAAARLAADAGLPVSSHAYPELSVHLLAACPSAHLLEFHRSAAPVLADPLHAVDGFVEVPAVPGAGICWDEEAVARFASSRVSAPGRH
jgi:mandelate racemase